MRAEDLELLEKLSHLDTDTLRDLDSLTRILLRQNRGAAIAKRNRSELSRTARTLGWSQTALKDFLLGVETALDSPIVAIEKILATPDFCLMLWRFKRAKALRIFAEIPQPLVLYLVGGCAQIQIMSGQQGQGLRVVTGDFFQTPGPLDLQCHFEANAEVLFFDFPVFREAQRNLRRFSRFRSPHH